MAENGYRDLITKLRGLVRAEKDPVRKEVYSGLVELVASYEKATGEKKEIFLKHIRNGMRLLSDNGEERPEKP